MTIKSSRRPTLIARRLLAAAALGWLGHTAVARPAGPAEFGVRSMVADPSPTTPRGRHYAVLSVQMVSSDPQNMPPVDEDMLMSQVCHALDGHGFRPVEKGRNPEILITIHYGRAWLRNPYLGDTGDSQAIDGFSSMPSIVRRPTSDVAGASTRLMDERSRNHEALVQKAAAEKLYVRVTGWRYPTDPKAKAEMLWKTTTLVDDPDSWNLNAIAGAMLEAGAPYFDQPITEKEIEVHPPLPASHVNVGAPQVVDATPAKPGPAAPTPEAAEPRPVPAGKKFDLPAGEAVTTLQAFSRQSGEEIIYPVEQLRGIRTNEVHGEMSPRAALDRMLDGTGLSAVQDEKSEALAVRPAARR